MRGGLDIIKLTKTQLIYSVSRFNLGGLELCLWGAKPTKAPPWRRDCLYYVLFCLFLSTSVLQQARNHGGHLGHFPPPEIFKTLHSNFGICRNFQRIKMKFCIQIIFQKSLV